MNGTDHGVSSKNSSTAGAQPFRLRSRLHVRFGSLADIRELVRDVRFTPKSRHVRRRRRCLLGRELIKRAAKDESRQANERQVIGRKLIVDITWGPVFGPKLRFP